MPHLKIYDSHCAGKRIIFLQAKEPAAGRGGTKEEEKVVLDKDGTEESAAVKQMSTLVDLMRQQMEWTMRSEDGRREQGLGAAEALETRMRGMEVIRLIVLSHATADIATRDFTVDPNHRSRSTIATEALPNVFSSDAHC